MPGLKHEALHHIFRARPALIVLVLREYLGVRLPASANVTAVDTDLSEPVPAHQHADAVFEVRNSAGKLIRSVVIEVQLAIDPDKRFRWPHYASSLWAALKVPCLVLVVAPDAKVAKWAAQPFEFGGGLTMAPIVLGPSAIPIVDANVAQKLPELAVLSALAHRRSPQAYDVATTALTAVRDLPDRSTLIYWEAIRWGAGPAIARALEKFMFTDGELFTSEFAKKHQGIGLVKGIAEGIAKARAEDVLVVLQTRDLAVTAEQRERILSCQDIDTLDKWLKRAVSVASADQLFE